MRLPKLPTRRTTPFTAPSASLGLGMANFLWSVILSPILEACEPFDSQAATGAKMSRP